MSPAIRELLKNDRTTTRRARNLDAVVGRMLSQVKNLRAVGEHRRTPLAEVEPSRVEFSERAHERARGLALRSGKPIYFSDDFAVGESLVRKIILHVSVYHGVFRVISVRVEERM